MVGRSNPQNKGGGQAVFRDEKRGKEYSDITGADCLRLKIYWGYMIKQNRKKTLDEMEKASQAPLEHLYDNHEFCGAWCRRRNATIEEKGKSKQYYRSMEKHGKLYAQMKEIFQEFTSRKRLQECRHK